MLSTLIPNVEEIGAQIWAAKLSEADLRQLGSPLRTGGQRSVVILTADPEYIGARSELRVVNGSAFVAMGASESETTLFIAAPVFQERSSEPNVSTEQERPVEGLERPVSDSAFLESLSSFRSDLADLARDVLEGVRRMSPEGHLELSPVARRWIEKPDNFWTIKVQPQARSLSLTIRGPVESHSEVPGIELKRDMGSYSRFTITSREQVSGTLQLLREAKEY